MILDYHQERIFERTGEFDFKVILQERVYERTWEQIDVSFPHVLDENFEVASLIPQERSQPRTVEEIVETSLPQTQEQSFEVIKVIPQARVSIRIVEQTGFTVSPDRGGYRCSCEVGPSCATIRERNQGHSLGPLF